jgi:hypothetical protein
VAVTDRDRAKLAYWTSFAEYMKANPSTFRPRKPGPSNWRVFPIGRSGVVISAGISMDKQRVSVELYIDNDVNKAAFRALLAQREVIEREFGEPLDWQELPDKKATRIALYQHGVDPSDERQYPALHAWMLPKMDRFRSVFERRVKALPHRSAIVAADLGESSEE